MLGATFRKFLFSLVTGSVTPEGREIIKIYNIHKSYTGVSATVTHQIQTTYMCLFHLYLNRKVP